MDSTTKPKERSKDCKFIPIGDPNTKEQLNTLAKPPNGATNYIFWEVKEGNEDYPTGGWGLTIKQMPLKEGKKHSGQHIWKVTWYFDSKTNNFKTARHSKSLVEDINGAQAAEIVKIYNNYKK